MASQVFLLFLLVSTKYRYLVIDSEDTKSVSRVKRQFENWPPVLPVGPCFTSKGHFGRCTSFRQCYPYFKLPELTTWETWVLGMYDTCSYFSSSGKQMFGVCCTNPVTMKPTPPPRPTPPTPPTQPTMPTFPSIPTNSPSEGQRPGPGPIPPNWPPPIPTHPPDHTIPPLPTHPPSPGYPGIVQPYPPTTSKPIQPIVTKPPPTTPKPQYPWLTTKPTKPPTLPPQPVTPQPPAPVADAGSCGSRSQPDYYYDSLNEQKIVLGQDAIKGEWPWMAALFNSGRQFCGGSLIDNIHILTAAHCVAHMSAWDVARLSVRLGDHDIRTNDGTHIEKKVKRVVRHRGFDSRTLYNDIAILTLDSPVSYTRTIHPICLPSGSASYSGKIATVIGWGSLREGGRQPAILQKVEIDIWSNQKCRAKYGQAAPGGIVDHFLCAGKNGKDSCSGDSGGPLMINEGRWTQVGIVSWGIGCGQGQYPGVYTRVTHFLPWITKNTK